MRRLPLYDSDDDGMESLPLWQQEYEKYLHSKDGLGTDESVVTWWSVRPCYTSIPVNSVTHIVLSFQLRQNVLPTWASLAMDFLPIMASSVSSERAFSSAGITITKRRNRLKAGIVEALQSLKHAMRSDTMQGVYDSDSDNDFTSVTTMSAPPADTATPSSPVASSSYSTFSYGASSPRGTSSSSAIMIEDEDSSDMESEQGN